MLDEALAAVGGVHNLVNNAASQVSRPMTT
jgi:NAD(P)-dependent dehydrogenase (short-subunit alcohol dehydrogenase family)